MSSEVVSSTSSWTPPQSGRSVTVGPLKSSGLSANIFCELAGPVDGQLVVLVNGIGEYFYSWDFLVPVLHASGFRTLRYDHFNRGFSDTIESQFDGDLYVDALHALLNSLSLLSKKFYLIGHSLGGAIAVAFTAKYSESVAKLVLLAPAGFFPTPFVAKVFGWMLSKKVIKESTAASFVRKGDDDAIKDIFWNRKSGEGKEMYEYCASRQRLMAANRPERLIAFVRTVRHCKYLFNVKSQAKQSIAANPSRPILIVCGDHDKTVPVRATIKGCRAVFPANTPIEVIEGTRHCFFMEKREKFHSILLPFLTK
eukprot:c4777_g1_i1.p1 GENE.c4777_g1_i1~~c4777_g1_i1.p1  ORF type:complete len:325 (+),score=65.73 c4777_g1_i1:43-975(+)